MECEFTRRQRAEAMARLAGLVGQGEGRCHADPLAGAGRVGAWHPRPTRL